MTELVRSIFSPSLYLEPGLSHARSVPPSALPRKVPMLDAGDCASILATLESLRPHWIRRHPTASSYTMAGAGYLDVPSIGVTAYLVRSIRGNTLLRRRFAALYERLRLTLAGALGGDFAYTNRFAIPGFHIFELDDSIKKLEPSLHFDLQDRDLDWGDGDSDKQVRPPGTRVSFTLPIAVPSCGAGLHIWPIDFDDVPTTADDYLQAQAAAHEPEYFDYRPGELLIHTGDRLHRIAGDRPPPETPGEARVTLQGHARLTNGTWILYW